MKNLTLIIPAKKEAESLPSVLDELKNFNLKIIIVTEKEDHATIDSIKDKKNNHEILFQKKNGYGNAIIEGINKAQTDYICIFNADGSFNPNELQKMYNKADEGFDFIFASRYQNNSGSEDDTILTLIGNKIFTFLVRILFFINITDVLYTFVLAKKESIEKLNLNSQDFGLCVEIPIKAKKNNFKMISLSSYERKRIAGTKKVNEFKDGFLILFKIIKYFFKYD